MNKRCMWAFRNVLVMYFFGLFLSTAMWGQALAAEPVILTADTQTNLRGLDEWEDHVSTLRLRFLPRNLPFNQTLPGADILPPGFNNEHNRGEVGLTINQPNLNYPNRLPPIIQFIAAANSGLPKPLHKVRAKVSGFTYLDFCIVSCDGTDTGPISVTFTYVAQSDGRLTTFSPGSTAIMTAKAWFRDLTTNKDYDVNYIEDETLGNRTGKWKKTVPLPESESYGVEVTHTFVANFRKGRVYRFYLQAIATATAGAGGVGSSVIDFDAGTIIPFLSRFDFIEDQPNGQVSLLSFMAEVPFDQVGNLEERVTNLEETIYDNSGSSEDSSFTKEDVIESVIDLIGDPPEGEQGPQGEIGPQGLHGVQGIQGEVGPQGIQGVVGPRGIQGEVGPQGIQGEVGPQGIQGEVGPQGIQGDVGPQGEGLFPGSLLMVPVGSAQPDGYSFFGTFKIESADNNSDDQPTNAGSKVTVDVYIRNP